MNNIDKDTVASKVLKAHNLSDKFSMRRAFILGMNTALENKVCHNQKSSLSPNIISDKKSGKAIDLDKLESKLDRFLNNEKLRRLKKWLKSKRSNKK